MGPEPLIQMSIRALRSILVLFALLQSVSAQTVWVEMYTGTNAATCGANPVSADFKTTTGQCSCYPYGNNGYGGVNCCFYYYKVTGSYTLQLYADSSCTTTHGSALALTGADSCASGSSSQGYKVQTSDTTAVLNNDCSTAGTCSCLDASGDACPEVSCSNGAPKGISLCV